MATETSIRARAKSDEVAETAVTTGPAAAAMISGAIGTFVIGLLTTGAVIFEGLREALNWWNPAGPLTGKTGVGVIAWLISWALLNTVWKGKEYDLRQAFVITLVFVTLGVILTFPPVFEAFE
ncbi:MAG TPA: hypothetical protein VFO91_09575 [Anaerolineales bacterium]|nr:hypothetical protein [Anaerolineales bacterium]